MSADNRGSGRYWPAALAALMLAGCSQADGQHDAKALIAAHCAACHIVRDVPTARGRVGPSLKGIGRRAIIAGRVPNRREALIGFLMHPRSVEPAGAMPEMGLTRDQAARIADYLTARSGA